ncbi:MAG: SAM-dependent chlorinase/fluorinase [Proteobacteria bacterium]|nr:SAM-dependent chlorinase/fluorinase [Pseudomonadota bacterium]
MRPIVLATDYGTSGAYVGQLKSAIYTVAPGATIIDLTHELPEFNPRASAYLLASFLEYVPPESVIVGVVDPGVGSARLPVVLEGDGYAFTGPDNGLFSIVSRKLSKARWSEILLSSEPASNTFHGHDIFAPVAAKIASGLTPRLAPVPAEDRTGIQWPDDLHEIVLVDHFGNGVTGIRYRLSDQDRILKVHGEEIRYAQAFHCVGPGESLWYGNSNGLIEVAVREGSAAERFNLGVGEPVDFGAED